jgi:signal transduction histidine kinase
MALDGAEPWWAFARGLGICPPRGKLEDSVALARESLLRTFAILSFITVASTTGVQVAVQWMLLRDDLIERERVHGANAIRIEAYASLEPGDFARWRTPAAQERFEQFFRKALLNPEVLRVKVYDGERRIVWSDDPHLIGQRSTGDGPLGAALQGVTVVQLANERRLHDVLELYVPLAFAPGPAPGTARISGVVEVSKDPSRALASLSRGRQIIVLTSLGGAVVLYGALFSIVRRASRRLRAQQEELTEHAAALHTANRDLTAMQGQLRANERLAAVGEVSAAVAHGIRNPLANIRASAQVALDEGATTSSTRHLNTITGEVDRLDRWLRALLDVVRPFSPQLGPVDVNALVEDCIAVLAERAAERRAVIEPRLTPGLPPVSADEVHLQQALLSVLENALDAVRPGGHVEVATARGRLDGDGAVIVTIVDDGVGIPDDRLEKIFEPFFTTKSRGTGLGLAIARKVIEGHGGRVELTSRVGSGTTVALALREIAVKVVA